MQYVKYELPHYVARHWGFPEPRPGAWAKDSNGHLWVWEDPHAGLGGFGDLGAWTTIVGTGASLAGSGVSTIGELLGAGAIAGPIGAGIEIIGSLIASIFGQHAQKVAQENKISGAWAASGPQTISGIMSAWQSGQASGPEAQAALQQVYQSFLQQNQSIAKYNGQTGSFPDPNAPRPSSNCNWACGTSWDLHQEISGLTNQINANPGVGGGLGALTSGGALPLLLLGAAALFLLK